MEHTPANAGFNLPDAVLRHRWLAAIISACTLAGTAGALVSLPNVYRAAATVIVQRKEVAEAFARSAVTSELETQIQTISQETLSRSRLEPLITRFDLYADLRRRAPMEEAVNRMRNDIKLELKEAASAAHPATVAFSLEYIGTDPLAVARVTNELARSYVEENQQIREGQASGTAQLLKAQLDDVKRRLDEQGHQAIALRRQYAGELPEQTTANLATLERLNTELHLNSDKQVRTIERREALRQASAGTQLPPGASDLSPTGQHLADLKVQLSQLRARFTERHPDVVRVEAEIADLESRLAAPGSSATPSAAAAASAAAPLPALTEVERDLQKLESEKQSIRLQMTAYERRVENAPQREQVIKEGSRDYGTTAELYYSLLKRYEDARLAENMEQRRTGEQFRILDSALPPTEPAAPNRPLLLLLGCLLALAAGVGAALVADQLNTSFHSLDDLREFTSLPILAAIPPIVTRRDLARQKRYLYLGLAGTLSVLTFTFVATQHLAAGNVQLVRLFARGKL